MPAPRPTNIVAHSQLITNRVPDPASLLHDRAYLLGGRAHQRPHYSLLSTVSGDALSKPPSWSNICISSADPECKVTFRKVTSTFSFMSLKNRRTQSGEGPHEYQNAIEKEVDPHYVDYQLHGLRIHYDDATGPHFYTVDCVSTTAAGEIIAEEVKASVSYFAEPSYATLMAGAANALGKVDITFRKVTGDSLQRAKRRVYNVKRAFTNRFTAFSEEQVDRVGNILHSAGSCGVPMAKVEEALGVHPFIARPTINALLCARHLSFDLGLPLHGDLPVNLAPQRPASLPNIRAIQR